MPKTKQYKLSDLVVTESFEVLDVVSSYEPIQKDSRGPVGERSFSSSFSSVTGYDSNLELKVVPTLHPDIPVRTLTFNGNSPVMKGHLVVAKIPRYTERHTLSCLTTEPPRYTARKFRKTESAIELKILDENGITLRTDRSAEYNSFYKK